MATTAISRLLNSTVAVRRRQTSDDGMGGQQIEWETIMQLPARVSSPPTSSTQGTLAAAQTLERVPFYVYLQPDSGVRRGDVLIDEFDRKLWVEAVTWPSIREYDRAEVREWQAEPQEAG